MADKRGRVRVSRQGHANLASVRTQEHEFYIGYEDADGTIHLVPAVLVPARAFRTPLETHGVIERLAEEFSTGLVWEREEPQPDDPLGP